MEPGDSDDQEIPDMMMNDTSLEPNAHCENGQGDMEIDSMEETVELPLATKYIRMSSWQKKMTASTAERESLSKESEEKGWRDGGRCAPAS